MNSIFSKKRDPDNKKLHHLVNLLLADYLREEKPFRWLEANYTNTSFESDGSLETDLYGKYPNEGLTFPFFAETKTNGDRSQARSQVRKRYELCPGFSLGYIAMYNHSRSDRRDSWVELEYVIPETNGGLRPEDVGLERREEVIIPRNRIKYLDREVYLNEEERLQRVLEDSG